MQNWSPQRIKALFAIFLCWIKERRVSLNLGLARF